MSLKKYLKLNLPYFLGQVYKKLKKSHHNNASVCGMHDEASNFTHETILNGHDSQPITAEEFHSPISA